MRTKCDVKIHNVHTAKGQSQSFGLTLRLFENLLDAVLFSED